ncbi:MAG TPA: V-type ATP synthase subunit F [Steroidobacteraceae bacterium]|nr:V-type ATP synthase subunit F [Steroidobacteraceae bacterium]
MDVAVIADELTAVGWRLAGAQVSIASPADVDERFRQAWQRAEVVMITAQLAARVSAPQLQAALEAYPPLTLVIPDLRHSEEPPDLEAQARRALGVLP